MRRPLFIPVLNCDLDITRAAAAAVTLKLTPPVLGVTSAPNLDQTAAVNNYERLPHLLFGVSQEEFRLFPGICLFAECESVILILCKHMKLQPAAG